MIEKQLTIDKWLEEEYDYLYEEVTNTIKNRSRLHIKAPLGTGKTFSMVQMIESLYNFNQIIVLVPQIAIANTVHEDLDSKQIPSFRFNGEDRDKLNKSDLQYPIISTIDSGHLLFDPKFEYNLDPNRTIIFIDETHALLTEGKLSYDITCRALDKAGCPVIGFSATPVAWVTRHLLKFDTTISISATSIHKKEVVPIKVTHSIPSTLTNLILENEFKKVVIFTSSIKDQERIRDEILAADSNKQCLVLNRPSRLDEEKKAWNQLLKNRFLSKGTEVLLMNKVAQAGISINDKDIDAVFMVGKFDPVGFIQYLGRCRNYNKPYYYLYYMYGQITVPWQGSDAHEEYQELMQEVVEYLSDTEIIDINDLKYVFNDIYSPDPVKGIVLNKCVLANKFYSRFRELRSETLLRFIKDFDPTIKVELFSELSGMKTNIDQKKKANKRQKLSQDLPLQIAKYARYIYPMVDYVEGDISYTTFVQLISDSKPTKALARSSSALYIPKTKKAGIKQTFKNINELGIGFSRPIVAAQMYIKGKNNILDIENVLNMSSTAVSNAINSYMFFNTTARTEVVKKVLKLLKPRIEESEKAEEWISWITLKLGKLPGSADLAKKIYKYCCVMKTVQITENGVKLKRRKLAKVLHTRKEYLDEHKEQKGLYD